MKLQLFNISNFKVDGVQCLVLFPKILCRGFIKSDGNNLINLTLRSMVIETPGRVILLDTGWGDKQDEKFFRHANLHGGEGLIGGLITVATSPKILLMFFLPTFMPITAEEE